MELMQGWRIQLDAVIMYMYKQKVMIGCAAIATGGIHSFTKPVGHARNTLLLSVEEVQALARAVMARRPAKANWQVKAKADEGKS